MVLNNRILIYPIIALILVILTGSSFRNIDMNNDQTKSNPISVTETEKDRDAKVYETVKDRDGNVYETVTIGTQVWMAENLKTTKYRNGEPITNVLVNSSWATLTTGAYCWYNNDATANKSVYGALYNWFTVTDKRNIAPAGWHVPSNAEWNTLIKFLNGDSFAGGELKEALTSHWVSPNFGANNGSGFTALPGGYRKSDGVFTYVGYCGGWWTSTEYSKSVAWYRYLDYSSSSVGRTSSFKKCGFSVRCVKD